MNTLLDASVKCTLCILYPVNAGVRRNTSTSTVYKVSTFNIEDFANTLGIALQAL